jgi:hypothetical protein
VNLPEQLQEGFLCQVFRFRWIASHAQAESVHATAVHLVDSLKCCCVALLRPVYRLFEEGRIGLKSPSILLRTGCLASLRGRSARLAPPPGLSRPS